MGNLAHVKLDRDMRIAIVLGSSKADGNTHQFAEAVAAVSGGRVFDLSDYDITYYDYKHQNESDDFLELMRTLVDADHIVCLLYTSPSPRDKTVSRMPSSA